MWLANSQEIIGQMMADTRRLSADILWQNFIDWPSGDRFMPNDQGTFGRYHDAKFLKKSANHRATITRLFTDNKTPKKRRIGQQNFNFGASTKKLSADQ